MRTKSKTKQEAAESLLGHSYADRIGDAEVVRKVPRPSPPTSVRLSAPLLERLDRLAEAQGRKRSNLIQFVLWEYVRATDRT